MVQGVVAEWTEAAGTMVLGVVVRGVAFSKYLAARWPLGMHPEALARVHARFAKVPEDIRKTGGGR
jgi:hypothetical protein